MKELMVAVIEDEHVLADEIAALVQAADPACRTEVFAAGEQCLARGPLFDIAFVDIQLPGIDGIETARQLRALNDDTVVVFVTALPDRVFEAFDAHPYQYLLKPVDPSRLQHTFSEAAALVRTRVRGGSAKLRVHARGGDVLVDLSDILYIESQARKVSVHTADGRTCEMYGSLADLESRVGSDFYRSHRAFLVNLAQVAGYSTDSITLKNGESVFLAKKKYSDFVKRYMWYLQEKHGIV